MSCFLTLSRTGGQSQDLVVSNRNKRSFKTEGFASIKAKTWIWPLKVSKFQNEFMKSSFLPKYELKIVRISALQCGHSTGQKSLQQLAHILGETMTSKIHSEIYRPLAWHPQFQNSFPSINWRAPLVPPSSDGPVNFSLASFRLSLISLCKVHEAHLQGCVNSQNNFAKIEFFTQQLTFFTRNISSQVAH